MVPGRKLSTSTSAVATRRPKRGMSLASFKFKITLFLPRFHTREADKTRGSPPGGSILMTSAP